MKIKFPTIMIFSDLYDVNVDYLICRFFDCSRIMSLLKFGNLFVHMNKICYFNQINLKLKFVFFPQNICIWILTFHVY